MASCDLTQSTLPSTGKSFTDWVMHLGVKECIATLVSTDVDCSYHVELTSACPDAVLFNSSHQQMLGQHSALGI